MIRMSVKKMGRIVAIGAFLTVTLVALAPMAGANSWTLEPPMNSPRWATAAAVVDGKIYVFGGNIYTLNDVYLAQYLKSVEMFDPATGAWTYVSDLPYAMRSMTATAVGGKIYIVGGHDGGSTYASTWEYDPATDTYTPRAPMHVSRFNHTATAVNGKVYVFGGEPGPGGGPLSLVEVFDPSTDQWSVLPSSPPRYEAAAASSGQTIYLIGGGDYTQPYASVHAFDVTTSTWTVSDPLPQPSVHLAAASVDGAVFAAGGVYYGTLWGALRYDPDSGTWPALPPMNFNRSGLALVSVENTLYAIG